MKCDKFFTWFGVWITWFVVFSLIVGQEREVSVEDVSGPNDDISFDNKVCCSNQQDLFVIDKSVKEMRTRCTYARAEEENKSNVRMKSCDLYWQDSRVTMQSSH